MVAVSVCVVVPAVLVSTDVTVAVQPLMGNFLLQNCCAAGSCDRGSHCLYGAAEQMEPAAAFLGN